MHRTTSRPTVIGFALIRRRIFYYPMVDLNVRQAATSNITVPQCGSLVFTIYTTPPTTPPYSLIVYDDRDLIPTVYPLTVDRRVIVWTVVYPTLTTIVYNLVDSEGKSVQNPLEAKVLNGSTECLPPPSNRTSPLVVTSDVLRDLDPCSPLNTRIDGGKKPYTVSLVPIEVAPVINMTLGPNDDSLYWVNVLKPKTGLIVAVSDSQGQYGTSERFTATGSSNDTSCLNQITITHSFNSRDPFNQKSNTTSTSITPSSSSSSSSSTNIGENGANSNSQNDGGRTTAIVGATMGAVILLGLLFVLYRHRKGHHEDHRGIGFWRGNERITDSIPAPVPFNHSPSDLPMNQTRPPPTSFNHPYNVQPTSSSGNTGVAGAGMNVSSRKAAREAARVAQGGGVSALTAIQSSSGVQVRQHADAMAIIELPPAYRDAAPQ